MAKKKRRKSLKDKGIAAFGLHSQVKNNPAYQRRIEDKDLLWLGEAYKKRVASEPDLTIEEFAQRYGIEAKMLKQVVPESLGANSGDAPAWQKSTIRVWHGTTKDRARAIMEEGFRSSRGNAGKRIWFTLKAHEAHGIAQRRAKQRGEEPVVFRCDVSLDRYAEYDRPNPNHYAFRTRIAAEVIRGVEGIARERVKKLKQKERERQLTDVIITETSGELVIAYWLNSYLKLNGESTVSTQHPGVAAIKNFLDAQYANGRDEPISDEEMLFQVMIHLPEYFEAENKTENGERKTESGISDIRLPSSEFREGVIECMKVL